MKKLGVIGGLGPMATALFLKMIVEMTDADSDQEHIECIVYDCPKIPDRTKYILGQSDEDPAPMMMDFGKRLADQGASVIAIPCITATYFHPQVRAAAQIPVINAIEEMCKYFKKHDISCAGLMATSGTVGSGLFQKIFQENGLRLVVPSHERQLDIMHVIYQNVKAGKPVELERFFGVAEDLWQQGAHVLILGCTELSVVRENYPIGAGYMDALQLMAKCAVEACGTLRPEYEDIITRG